MAFIEDRRPDICLGIASYPEKRPEAASLDADLDALKIKADDGGLFITTRLFYENAAYFKYIDQVRARGIKHPVFSGIMPILANKQIKRITQLCHSELPEELEAKLSSVESDPEAVRRVGVEWAMRQVGELITTVAPGVHIFALNKAKSAIEIIKAARNA